jgi:hypothetical protein
MKNFNKLFRQVFITCIFFVLLMFNLNAQVDWIKLNEQWTNCYTMALQVSGPKIYMGTQSCGVIVSSDSGKTFPTTIPISTIPWGTNTGIFRNGNTIIVGVHNTNGIYRSTDNGVSWEKISGTTEPQGADDIIVDGTTIYAADQWGIFKMPLNGTAWTKIGSQNVNKALAVKGNKIVTGIFKCGVSVSDDGGNNWSQTYNLFTNCQVLIKCMAISGSNVLAGTDQGLYLSSDNCATWTKITSGLNNVNEIWEFLECNDKLYMASSYGVKVSSDNGLNWSNVGTIYLQAFCLAYESPYLFAGCPSYVYRMKIGSTSGIDEIEEKPVFSIFPNPSNQSTVISYQLTDKCKVIIKLYDLTGRKVAEMLNETVEKGEHTVNFYSNNLSEGIYYVKLQNDFQSKSQKLIVKH